MSLGLLILQPKRNRHKAGLTLLMNNLSLAEKTTAGAALIRIWYPRSKSKTSIDNSGGKTVFLTLFRTFRTADPLPGSSVAEQVTVNHLVAGSIPARAAISSFCHEVTRDDRTRLKLSLSVVLTEATN